MRTIKIYGASDDLIEIEGAIRMEFDHSKSEPFNVAFNDGTILSIIYNPMGLWKISVLLRGAFEVKIKEADDPDSINYSDVATITGDIKWISCGKAANS